AELSLLRAKAVREGTSSAVDLDALVEKGREVLDAGPDPVIAALDRVKAEGAQTTPEEDDR
ncbi:hypothetical protein ACYT6K_10750, partial [Streptococcus pyogenes]